MFLMTSCDFKLSLDCLACVMMRFHVSFGQPFQNQMSLIYGDLLNVYKLYSELISAAIAEGGPYASKSSFVKLTRSVKRECLRLIETFVEGCEDPHLVAQQLVPLMYDPILGDYARNVPDARDAEVLSLFAACLLYTSPSPRDRG